MPSLCAVEPAACDGTFAGNVIELQGKHLTGYVPTELALLSNLTNLHLEVNSLSGTLPLELTAMRSLEKFQFADNYFSGTLPTQIGRMPRLIAMQAASNRISGSLPPSMPDLHRTLQTVDLHSNRLSGTLPSKLPTWRLLTKFHCHDNSLSGTLPQLWNKYDGSHLYSLWVHANLLSGTITSQWGGGFGTSLQDLRLGLDEGLAGVSSDRYGSNRISGTIPTELGCLSLRLQGILAMLSSVSGTLPTELARLQNSQLLLLGGRQLSGFIPTELGALSNLGMLSVASTRVSGTLPAFKTSHLNQLPSYLQSVRDLLLPGNRLSGTLPNRMDVFAHADSPHEPPSRLTHFDFQMNSVSGTLPEHWPNPDEALTIDASRNQLSGTLPGLAWRNMHRLKTVVLEVNDISGTLPSYWSSWVSLETLSLRFNRFSGTLPFVWRSLFPAPDGVCHLAGNRLACPLPQQPLECVCNLSCTWLEHSTSQLQPPLPAPPEGCPAPPPPPPAHPPTPAQAPLTMAMNIGAVVLIAAVISLLGYFVSRRLRQRRLRHRGTAIDPLLLSSEHQSSTHEAQSGADTAQLSSGETSSDSAAAVQVELVLPDGQTMVEAKSMDDFEMLGFLGRGSSGRVYLARRRGAGGDAPLLAIKEIPKRTVRDAARALEEARIMNGLTHPFIVSIHHVFDTTDCVCLALSYAGGGDLFTYLESEGVVEFASARVVAAEVVSALIYLHSQRIIYRDLKPQNLLLGPDGHVILADFGIAKRLARVAAGAELSRLRWIEDARAEGATPSSAELAGEEPIAPVAEAVPMAGAELDERSSVRGGSSMSNSGRQGDGHVGAGCSSRSGGEDTVAAGSLALIEMLPLRTQTMVGTPNYMAPEVILGLEYGFSADWWALGVVLYEMLTCDMPFDEACGVADHFENLKRLAASPNAGCSLLDEHEVDASWSEEVTDFIAKLLVVDVSSRLGSGTGDGSGTGSEDVRGHAFLSGIDWGRLEAKDAGHVTPPFQPISPLPR